MRYGVEKEYRITLTTIHGKARTDKDINSTVL